LRLSKAGHGRPDEILEMRTDLVVSMSSYEVFLNEYESSFIEINKDS